MLLERKEATERRLNGTAIFQENQQRHVESRVDSTVALVENLPFSVDEGRLLELFAAQRPLKAAIARTKSNSQHRGLGYVLLPDQTSVQKAAEALNGHVLTSESGREWPIKVSLGPKDVL